MQAVAPTLLPPPSPRSLMHTGCDSRSERPAVRLGGAGEGCEHQSFAAPALVATSSADAVSILRAGHP